MERNTMSVESYNDFQALPEGCIATALSLTSPKDACRLSVVNPTFRSAAESDAVWERFLPPDYRDIILRSVDGYDSVLAKFRSKKELYFHLCDNPIIIDGGNKSFSLDKGTGKKCFMLAARDLLIVWGDTPEYWRWIPYPESRFPEVAELLDVCWFEIRGKINTSMLSSGTTYAAYLVFTSKSGIYGFEYQPAEATVGISGQDGVKRTVCLDPDGEQRHRYQIVPRRIFFNHRLAHIYRRRGDLASERITEYPKVRADKWMEVGLGEFYVDGEQNLDMEISLTETKGGNWKNGVVIQGIEIRPKAE
ncbi:F-box PP2-B10-like [Olea europaea subsp. europaea]|uniref:F-box PP2-B10-like n=1 Tax=Olea europaea subsp. europaea TaxID=158383 RepID=A0A8S0QLT4_OLEEU|nr:F-box PP2-B10-like [Olea europaea subsp. europaea]